MRAFLAWLRWVLVLGAVLGGRVATAQVAGVCGSGKNCSVGTLYASTRSTTASSLCWALPSGATLGNVAGVSNSAAVTGFFSGASCGSGLSTTLYSVNTTTGVVQIGPSTGAYYGQAAYGYSTAGVALTSLDSSSSWLLQRDTTLNKLWLKPGAPTSTTPWVDFGGSQHPTIQAREYAYTPGQETTAAVSWDTAPTIGGAKVPSFTHTDGAAASSGTLGSAPSVRDFRLSNTGAVAAPGAGSTSTAITTAFVRRDHGPRWCQWTAVSAKTSVRVWVGLTTAIPVNTDTLAADSIAFRSSSAAADANWQICAKDATTQTCTDTGASVNVGTAQLLCIDCREASACTAWVDGLPKVRTTANLPTTTTKMSPFWVIEALSAAARSFYAGQGSVETQ